MNLLAYNRKDPKHGGGVGRFKLQVGEYETHAQNKAIKAISFWRWIR